MTLPGTFSNVCQSGPAPGGAGVAVGICAVCRTALTVHQRVRGPTCDDTQCRWLHLRGLLVERRHQQERFERRMLRFRDRRLRASGWTDAASFPLAIVPFNGHRIVNLAERRRRRHRDHLERIVSEAARKVASRAAELPPRPEPDASPRERTVAAAGCAACQGHCCSQGKRHNAFLDVATMRRYFAEHPGARPRDILALYLSYLPNRNVVESCVYHTRRGCTLPRDIRADICNTWYCGGLWKFRENMAEAKASRGFAVATAGEQVIRHAVIDESGVHELPAPPESSRRAESEERTP